MKTCQKIKNHFIAQGDQLKIDFENYGNDAAEALTEIKNNMSSGTNKIT